MPAFATDANLLRGLRARDNAAYAQLYAGHYPAIERHVRQRGGEAAAAQDVFQETLLVLLARLDQADFTLTATLKTYVFAIAANLWLKQLRRDRRYEALSAARAAATLPDSVAALPPDDSAAQAQHWLARLTARCQQLLGALFFGGQTIRQLTSVRGYASVHTAQNQKCKCLEQARRKSRGQPGAD